MYQYNAVIQKVIDGDTIEISIDLGLSVWIHKEKIRLYGIDTPEVFGVIKGSPEWERGNMASEFVKMYLKENDEVIIDTFKDKREKYGRYLALVFIQFDQNALYGLTDIRSIGNLYCLNDILISKGLAKKYMI